MSDERSRVLVACGREIGVREIKNIKEVVALCTGLSQEELAHTICEHLSLMTASGRHKMKGCLRLLETLDDLGEIQLPAKRVLRPRKRDIAWTPKTAPGSEMCGELSDVGKVSLAVVSSKSKKALWNEYVDRYHMLGFKKPFGCRIRYFIVSGSGDELGCILLAGAAKSMEVRDKWIGWSEEIRLKNLPWIVNNARYLIFPWVRVKHLASHVLGRLVRRVREDWYEQFGYRPIMLETFVDPAHFEGTSYRAAGWTYLGDTKGRGLRRPGREYKTTPKMLFVKPLTKDFRERLCGELKGREAVE